MIQKEIKKKKQSVKVMLYNFEKRGDRPRGERGVFTGEILEYLMLLCIGVKGFLAWGLDLRSQFMKIHGL